MYPNGGPSQRQIIANNNPVKSVIINDEGGEKNKKQDNNCLQPRWSPLDLSHT